MKRKERERILLHWCSNRADTMGGKNKRGRHFSMSVVREGEEGGTFVGDRIELD